MEQTLTLRRRSIVRRRKSDVALPTRHCPECGRTMRSGLLEVLIRIKTLYLGWRTHTCTECGLTESRLQLMAEPDRLQYRTHVIC